MKCQQISNEHFHCSFLNRHRREHFRFSFLLFSQWPANKHHSLSTSKEEYGSMPDIFILDSLLKMIFTFFCAMQESSFKSNFSVIIHAFNSSTEILNGVIKSVKKEGEWKVTVAQSDWRNPQILSAWIYNICLSRVSPGSHRGSHEHANSLLLLQDVRHFGRGGDQ